MSPARRSCLRNRRQPCAPTSDASARSFRNFGCFGGTRRFRSCCPRRASFSFHDAPNNSSGRKVLLIVKTGSRPRIISALEQVWVMMCGNWCPGIGGEPRLSRKPCAPWCPCNSVPGHGMSQRKPGLFSKSSSFILRVNRWSSDRFLVTSPGKPMMKIAVYLYADFAAVLHESASISTLRLRCSSGFLRLTGFKAHDKISCSTPQPSPLSTVSYRCGTRAVDAHGNVSGLNLAVREIRTASLRMLKVSSVEENLFFNLLKKNNRAPCFTFLPAPRSPSTVVRHACPEMSAAPCRTCNCAGSRGVV